MTIITLAGVFTIHGGSALFNTQTLLIASALAIVVWLPVRSSSEPLFKVGVSVLVIFLLFIFPRLFGYLLFSDSIAFPYGDKWDLKTINQGLLYVLAGSALMTAGMLVYRFRPLPLGWAKESASHKSLELGPLVVLFLMYVVLHWFLVFHLDASPLSVTPRSPSFFANTLVQLLMGLIDLETVLIVMTAYLVTNADGNQKLQGRQFLCWAVFFLLLIGYIVVMSFSGSRSSVLRVVLMIGFTLLLFRGNFKLNIARLVAAIALVVVLGWISFGVATEQRIRYAISHNPYMAGAQVGIKSVDNQGTLSHNPYMAGAQVGFDGLTDQDRSGSSAPYRIQAILNRLGVVDFALAAITQNADESMVSKYFTLGYTFRSVANTLPGTVYPDAELSTSRLVPVVFRGISEDYVIGSAYFSEYYTVWGLLFLFFGCWGGLFWITVTGWCLVALYDLSRKLYYPYGSIVYLFAVPLLIVLSMGLDHTLVTSFIIMLRLAFCLAMVSFLSRLMLNKK